METISARDWTTYKDFSSSEFLCPCGCGKGPFEMRLSTLERLQLARKKAGLPFIINSGFRCSAHNEAVGGFICSSHLYGFAADVSTNFYHEGYNLSQLRYTILLALLSFFPRIGIARDYIHVDNDPLKAQSVMWFY